MPSTQYKSIIEMFSGCPFDNTYTHTLEAMDFQTKLTWLENNCAYKSEDDRFEPLMKIKMDSASNTCTVKIECKHSKAYYYNYAYLNNISGPHWFCFVTGCRYVNDASQSQSYDDTGIYEFDLEIDLMMSNLLSPNQLTPCMVTRQHSETDEIGDNIVGEPVSLMEMVNNSGYTRFIPDNAGNNESCIILYWLDPNATNSSTFIDGSLSGTKVAIFKGDDTGLASLNAILEAHKSNPKEIVGIALASSLYSGITTYGNYTGNNKPRILTGAVNGVSGNETLDGYTPKNKKLYTYPYNYLSIVNSNGGEMIIRYEFWGTIGGTHRLQIASSIASPVSYQLRPLMYKESGDGSTGGRAVDYFLELSGLPIGTWQIDNYELWKAQSQARIIGDYGKTAAGAIGTGATAMMFGANPVAIGGITLGVGIANTITNHISTKHEQAIERAQLGGTVSGSAVNFNVDTFGFFHTRKSLPYESAKMVDDFFTRFGYSQLKIMKPTTTARPYYTFLQVSDDSYVPGVASGSNNGIVNAKQVSQINSILKAGITFWSRSITKDNIFKYDELDNSPS